MGAPLRHPGPPPRDPYVTHDELEGFRFEIGRRFDEVHARFDGLPAEVTRHQAREKLEDRLRFWRGVWKITTGACLILATVGTFGYFILTVVKEWHG